MGQRPKAICDHICENVCADICEYSQIFALICVNTNICTNICTNMCTKICTNIDIANICANTYAHIRDYSPIFAPIFAQTFAQMSQLILSQQDVQQTGVRHAPRQMPVPFTAGMQGAEGRSTKHSRSSAPGSEVHRHGHDDSENHSSECPT